MTACGGSPFGPPDPDVPCCWGSAMGGHCTCWQSVYDLPVTDAVQEGPNPVQRHRCHDCAYRRDSPENAIGEPLPTSRDRVFWCHHLHDGVTPGLPNVIGYRHDGTGEVRDAPPGDSYEPIQRGGRTWNADGTPATLCAGWAALAGLKPHTPEETT